MQYRKLGIHFTQEKQEAILEGDVSGTVVHPLFVHQACSFGMHFYQSFIQTPGAPHLQARHSQSVWEGLAKILKGNNNVLKAQAVLSISTCCLIFRWIDYAHQYLHKACRLINMANLQFIPTCGQPPAYSEEICERSAILSQAIYFENYLFLTCGGAEPKSTARIEREFRCDLQVGNRGTCKLVCVAH